MEIKKQQEYENNIQGLNLNFTLDTSHKKIFEYTKDKNIK